MKSTLSPDPTNQRVRHPVGADQLRAYHPPILATSILRLQCLQQAQETREIGVHARQSREPGTGAESRRMDVDSFLFYEKGERGLAPIDPVD